MNKMKQSFAYHLAMRRFVSCIYKLDVNLDRHRKPLNNNKNESN